MYNVRLSQSSVLRLIFAAFERTTDIAGVMWRHAFNESVLY